MEETGNEAKRELLVEFIKKPKYAALATVSVDGVPQAALVGIAVTPDLQLVFDTLNASRKFTNLENNSKVAFVLGWDGDRTIQYEGIARRIEDPQPTGLLRAYFETFPEGIERYRSWKDISYFCVQPRWVRFSDFNESTQTHLKCNSINDLELIEYNKLR
jgi:pyridoxine/pyridoxamine 5'-phosphate oxidase